MAHVLIRALALLRHPWVTGGVAGLILGGIFLVRLPLFGVPGFELSAALTLACALFGGGIGMAAGRQERVLLAGTGTRPTRAKRLESPLSAVGAAVGASATLLTFTLLFPLGVSTGLSLVSTRCNPLAQLGFFPVLTLPTVALASAAGVFAGLWTRRLWVSWLLYLSLVLASIAGTLWPIYDGPQVLRTTSSAATSPARSTTRRSPFPARSRGSGWRRCSSPPRSARSPGWSSISRTGRSGSSPGSDRWPSSSSSSPSVAWSGSRSAPRRSASAAPMRA